MSRNLIICSVFGLLALASESLAEPNKLALQSLRYLYFHDNPTPPLPSQKEMARAMHNFKKVRGIERHILGGHLAADPLSLALAMRDFDGDGVRDYRIDEPSGKFMEGDVDVDGDGIRNVLDSHPYNPHLGGVDLNGDGQPDKNFADRNGNNIPDHVDWAFTPKSTRLRYIQQRLYRDHKIILVERTLPFTEKIAEAVYDTVTVVFKRFFRPVLPTLRSVATEERVHLTPAQDEGVSAMMIPQVQGIYLYRDAFEGAPLAVLGLMVHEIAHAIQFNMDFNSSNLTYENSRLVTFPKRYFSYLTRYGWQIKESPTKSKAPLSSIVGVWRESRPFSEFLRGKHLNQWQKWLDQNFTEFGYAFFKRPEARKERFVSLYAAYDIFEWHSETLMATVMQLLLESVHRRHHDQIEAIMHADLQKTWPEFHFDNIAGSVEAGKIAGELSLDANARSYLGAKYISRR